MLSVVVLLGILSAGIASVPLVRPPANNRTYQSPAIDALIQELRPLFASEDIANLLENCFPNSLDTTILYTSPEPNPDAFVITGDIEALWLRDSTNQLLPYIPYAASDPALKSLLLGLIARQAKSILIDPFANAFNYNASGEGHQDDIRYPPMTPAVFEGKYEIDSLCAFLKLSYWYFAYTKDTSFATANWFHAITVTLDTISTMQSSNGQETFPPYLFQRYTTVATDTLMMSGRGPPAKLTGLTRSLFRPSDDAVTLPYNIPGNAMACVEVNHLSDLLSSLPAPATLRDQATSIADTLCTALSSLSSPLPYEIDGFGNTYRMDDANVPSLLSLPVLGFYSPSHPVYQATRDFVLSSANPYYFTGTEGEGIGGPHVGYNYIWPMSLMQRIMTSSDDNEITTALDLLIKSAERTGFMHESFNSDNVNDYTRSWFAWANGMFGETILQLIETKPHLVLKNDEAVIAQAQALVDTPVSLRAQQEALYQ